MHIELKPAVPVLLIVLAISVYFTGCKEDEEPKTLPMVTTAEVLDVTTTNATASGEITSDGNATITASGVVYSNTSNTPTIADSKTETTTTTGAFTTELTGLTSGTRYYIRAYATNEVGTGYGETVTFTTGNAAPTVTGASITGELEVNKPLTATYTYSDAEGDGEGATSIRWYIAETGSGAGEVMIDGAAEFTYISVDQDEFKYIAVEILPKAVSGTTDGVAVKSAYVGPIAVRTTVTFDYNGEEVTYGIITSAETGRQWLDRNLGAKQMATAIDDYLAYGDLFQWGRAADGHQLITWAAADAGTAVHGTTTELSGSDTPNNSALMILRPTTPFDWRDPQNHNLWQGVDGINNPCPSGWRIPTSEEWAAENIDLLPTGFAKLKLPGAGTRSRVSGDLGNIGTQGNYWSSSVATDGIRTLRYNFRITGLSVTSTGRADAVSCRCIQ